MTTLLRILKPSQAGVRVREGFGNPPRPSGLSRTRRGVQRRLGSATSDPARLQDGPVAITAERELARLSCMLVTREG
ncbi:MAG: hypothetical protein OXH76_11240 [Boseongicola sp.]|nr:hypothetical protein [Boseongicola sp.]